MKFEKEKKESVIFSIRLKKSLRNDLQKIADREQVSTALVVKKAIEMLLEQDRKDLENERK